MDSWFLSQYGYLKKVVEWFRGSDSKIIGIILDHHAKILIIQYLELEDKKNKMKSTPYPSGVRFIVHGMDCNIPDLAYVIN